MKIARRTINLSLAVLLTSALLIALGRQATLAIGTDASSVQPQIQAALTPMPAQNEQILPGKLPGRALLLFTDHYTEPEHIRLGERFRLYLEIENQGQLAAIGWRTGYQSCNLVPPKTAPVFESACQQKAPDLAPGQKAWITYDMIFIDWPQDGISDIGFQLSEDGQDGEQSQVTVVLDVQDPQPSLVVTAHRTNPAQVYDSRPFELYLEIKNDGTKRASGYHIAGADGSCDAGDFTIQSQCNPALPSIDPGHSVEMALQMLSGDITDSPAARTATFKLINDDETKSPDFAISIGIQVFEGITVVSTQPVTVGRPFVGAHVEIKQVWATVVSTDGAKYVALTVEVGNKGASEARNIVIDLCPPGSDLKPYDNHCLIELTAPLAPGQTANERVRIDLPPKDIDTLRAGARVYNVAYDFWHVDEWLHVAQNNLRLPQVIVVEDKAASPRMADLDPCANLDTAGKPSICVTVASLNVRQEPGTTHAQVGSLYRGDVREVFSKEVISDSNNPEWLQIEFEGGKGWVSARYVNKYDVIAIPETTPDGGADPDPENTPSPSTTAEPAEENAALGPGGAALDSSLSGPASDATSSVPARLFIENPTVMPEHPTVGEQFVLTFDVLNPQQAPVSEVVIAMTSEEIAPLGVATYRVGPLAAGQRRSVSAPMLLKQAPATDSVVLELNMTLYDEHGVGVELPTERIGFAWVDGRIALGSVAPAAATRPIWQRFVLGFVGLGAGPR